MVAYEYRLRGGDGVKRKLRAKASRANKEMVGCMLKMVLFVKTE